VVDSKEMLLEQFREDLRRMGPDGTKPSNYHNQQFDAIHRKFVKEFLDGMVSCPPEFTDTMCKHWTEMLA